jgi:hypothetical protein
VSVSGCSIATAANDLSRDIYSDGATVRIAKTIYDSSKIGTGNNGTVVEHKTPATVATGDGADSYTVKELTKASAAGDLAAMLGYATGAQTAAEYAALQVGEAGAGLTAIGDPRLNDATTAKTQTTAAAIRASLGLAAANLDTQLTIYFADVKLNRDGTHSTDEYNIQWFKNGAPATLVEAGAITAPKITVISRAGATLVSSQSLTEVSSGLGSYKYDATSGSRATAGDAVLVIVSATIGGATRSFAKWVY